MRYSNPTPITRPGSNPKTLWEDGLPIGESDVCPFCGKQNIAYFYDPEEHSGLFGDTVKLKMGQLISWPNDRLGVWCSHCAGVYAGGGRTGVEFHFRGYVDPPGRGNNVKKKKTKGQRKK